MAHDVKLIEGTMAFPRHWSIDDSKWLSYDGETDCVTSKELPKSVKDAVAVEAKRIWPERFNHATAQP